jgi:hypothetical protein
MKKLLSVSIKKIKALVRQILPKRAIAAIEKLIAKRRVSEFNRKSDEKFANKTPKEVFSYIYKKKLWGEDTDEDFYSGSGSHNLDAINIYVKAIQGFVSALPIVPNVVDLGCGDFNIGKHIRPMCKSYTACDVVNELVERNKKVFHDLEVLFLCLDMCEDTLPEGDIVFIRQVLQHLSNHQISQVVEKLRGYKYVVITEGLPAKEDFTPNVDKPIGDGVRFQRKISSGVVLALPPFNMPYVSEVVLCEVPVGEAVIRTTVYQMW